MSSILEDTSIKSVEFFQAPPSGSETEPAEALSDKVGAQSGFDLLISEDLIPNRSNRTHSG